MPVQRRALIIGLAGPVTQALGVVWESTHLILHHSSQAISLRHVLFDPGFLLIMVGLLLTMACVPVALEVARALPEEVEIPIYEPAEVESPVVGRPAG